VVFKSLMVLDVWPIAAPGAPRTSPTAPRTSPTTGIRALVRLGGGRERDPSLDQASDVGDSHLRGRLLGN